MDLHFTFRAERSKNLTLTWSAEDDKKKKNWIEKLKKLTCTCQKNERLTSLLEFTNLDFKTAETYRNDKKGGKENHVSKNLGRYLLRFDITFYLKIHKHTKK